MQYTRVYVFIVIIIMYTCLSVLYVNTMVIRKHTNLYTNTNYERMFAFLICHSRFTNMFTPHNNFNNNNFI